MLNFEFSYKYSEIDYELYCYEMFCFLYGVFFFYIRLVEIIFWIVFSGSNVFMLICLDNYLEFIVINNIYL